MTTIKSYTDISQSKKLAEILSLESADMYWWYNGQKYYAETKEHNDFQKSDIPCWSLAALFNVLPEYIKFDGHTWKFYNDHYGVYYMNADTYDTNTFSTSSENLVDDCYEMVLKLHELNLL